MPSRKSCCCAAALYWLTIIVVKASHSDVSSACRGSDWFKWRESLLLSSLDAGQASHGGRVAPHQSMTRLWHSHCRSPERAGNAPTQIPGIRDLCLMAHALILSSICHEQGEAEPTAAARSGAPSKQSSMANLQASQPPSRSASFRVAPTTEEARKRASATPRKEMLPAEPVSHTMEMFAHLPQFKVSLALPFGLFLQIAS